MTIELNSSSNFFQLGGTLKAGIPSYVSRKADQELYNYLKKGEYCYILNSRQMGKSSLMLKVGQQLEKEGFLCCFIDLSMVISTTKTTSEQFYNAIVIELGQQLLTDFNFLQCLQKYELKKDVFAHNIFRFFIEEILLKKTTENIVIFFDEIDKIISLKPDDNDYAPSFTDDFFTFIRGYFNRRASNLEYNRLAFVLAGVAKPEDLIETKEHTPFNIGKSINLQGLSLAEAKKSFLKGLATVVENPEVILKEVLAWTGGQPFLTQKLLLLILAQKDKNKLNIEQIVRYYLIENWEKYDNPVHFVTIQKRLLSNDQLAPILLDLYKQILTKDGIKNENRDEYRELKLTGLVIQEGNKLKVFNPIYRSIFSQDWVEEKLAKILAYSDKFKNWRQAKNQETREKYLLTDSEIQEVINWKKDKNTPHEYENFLDESQEFVKYKWKKRTAYVGIVSFFMIILFVAALILLNQINSRLNNKTYKLINSFLSLTQSHLKDNSGKQINAYIETLELVKNFNNLFNQTKIDQNQLTKFHFITQEMMFKNHLEEDQLVYDVDFSNEGNYIAAGLRNGLVKIWNLHNKNLNRRQPIELVHNNKEVYRVLFSKNGKYLATTSEDGYLKIWDWQNNPTQPIRELNFNGQQAYGINFNADDQLLAIALRDGSVKIWNWQQNIVINLQAQQQNKQNQNTKSAYGIEFIQNDQFLLTSFSNNEIIKWDLGEILTPIELNQNCQKIVLDENNSSNLFKQNTNTKEIDSPKIMFLKCQVKAEKINQKLLKNSSTNNYNSIYDLTFSSNQNLLAFGDEQGTITLQSLARNNYQQQSNPETLPRVFLGHNDIINSINYSSEQNIIATGSVDKTVKIWDTQGNLLQTFSYDEEIYDVTFNPQNEQEIAVATSKGFYLLDILKPKEAFHHNVEKVKISPDQKWLVTAAKNSNFRLWKFNPSSKSKTNQLQLVSQCDNYVSIKKISFSPDSQKLAIAFANLDDSLTIEVFNLNNFSCSNISVKSSSKVTEIDKINQDLIEIKLNKQEQQVINLSKENLDFNQIELMFTGQSQKLLIALVDKQKYRKIIPDNYQIEKSYLSPDGRNLAIVLADNNYPNKNEIKLLKSWLNHQDNPEIFTIKQEDCLPEKSNNNLINTQVSFDSKGEHVVIAWPNNQVCLYDLTLVKKGNHLKPTNHQEILTDKEQNNHQESSNYYDLDNRIFFLSFIPNPDNPDEELFATFLADGRIQLFNKQGIPQYQPRKLSQSTFNGIDFTPDGEYLTTISTSENTVTVWQLKPELLTELKLEKLTQQGCQWLNDYYVTHPTEKEKQKDCSYEAE
jgi:WD40 repeat protein